MKILVVSDTHLHTTKKDLPERLLEDLKSSDVCIHAGDFVEYTVFKELSSITTTYGVCGNMDDYHLRNKLPPKQIIELGSIKIGLTHGRGSPYNIISVVNSVFKEEFPEIKIFIFGHSHTPLDTIIDGKIYFNPGSPTDRIFAPYNSYGIIEIKDGKLERRIVKIG